MRIVKNKKNAFFFSCPKDHLTQNPKSKGVLCSSLTDTDRQTHTHTLESEYRGHPFRVSSIFPSIYHQGSVQKTKQQKTDRQ